MQSQDLASLTQHVLWAAFAVGLVFGAIAQKTHFCTMGAISDVVNMGDWTRARQWALAMGVAMLGFSLLVFFGQIDASKTLYYSTRWIWLSTAIGGLLFGLGMVLASGCGSKSLVRLGSGSLKSLVVLLTMAVAGFATLKGITAVLRVSTVDQIAVELSDGASLPYLFASAVGISPPVSGLALSLLVGGALAILCLASREFRQRENLWAGFGIGAAIVAMWWISGAMAHLNEHPETLEEVFLATNSGRIEALSFVAPVSYALDWLMFYSDKSKVLTIGIVSVTGVVVGSALSALSTSSFRWEGFVGTEDVANHLVGGLLMGVGGVTAMGCTIGQGLSGMSTLSLNSLVALGFIVLGAVVGFRYQSWRVDHQT